MSRIRSFATPHKGLRNVLSKFSLQLGFTDFGNQRELEQLKDLGEEMFTLLEDHVITENEFTLKKLEERAPGSSAHDMHDHEKLEESQASLREALSAFTGRESQDEIHSYYLSFSLFHSKYLQHIYEEETVTEFLLQQHFTDEELVRHRIMIMQQIQPEILILWLKYIVPAQHEQESLPMLRGLKSNAPQEIFTRVMDTIRIDMHRERYQRLTAQVTDN